MTCPLWRFRAVPVVVSVPVMFCCTDMQKENHNGISNQGEPVFIGKIIEEELRRQERSVTWLSRQIHCDRRNVYDIFSRTTIDTGLLFSICRVLHVDFFSHYSRLLTPDD